MKVWGEIPRILGIYGKQKNVGKVNKTSPVESKKDVISISGGAKDYQTALRALKNVPDMRAEKVRELSEKYQSGNYDIKGKDVADKIIQSFIDKKV